MNDAQKGSFLEGPATPSSGAATGTRSPMPARSTSTTTGPTTPTTMSASADPRKNSLDAGHARGRNILGRELPGENIPKSMAHKAQPRTVAGPTGAAAEHGAMVAVLFAREDSIYKTIPGCDVYDATRDARTYDGPWPVVAHPPCRAWGRLRHLAKPRADEKELAIWAVQQVRRFGGVLEHPKASTLWPVAGLPVPGERDAHGGWTLPVLQYWWGHKADKATLLYIVGCEPKDIPQLPMVLGTAPYVVGNGTTNHITKGQPGWRPQIPHAEREHTPPQLALWLCQVARGCGERRA